ncbi:MAG: hypothetical protein HC813_01425 [Planctomycetes bacterium]|nr:hypothetical protein [Planctomycetota bacterium]
MVEQLAGPPVNPDYYPVEFYLETGTGTEIAHIYFDEWDDDQGGVLKNQIPLGSFKTGTTFRIRVPATTNEWSQAAFAPFLKIFNAIG